jgi:hypothetical protein
MTIEFKGFPKIYRASRECIITEKIDGTNAQIYITEDGQTMIAGSRKRWISPENDNYGFAAWVRDHHDELIALGPGQHFGEWWGQGIQRAYDLKEKRFSLFNTSLWSGSIVRPDCCDVVPVLYKGIFSTVKIDECIESLKTSGSVAAPGFMRPEGVVCCHVQGNFSLKKTIEHDEEHKGKRGEINCEI